MTDQHMINVSMCASFLLEAAKKCDKIFSVPPRTTAHTIRSAQSDINMMAKSLIENSITLEDVNRTAPNFIDPTERGLNTLSKGDWLQRHLSSAVVSEDQENQEHGEMDNNIDYYELTDL